MIETILLDVDGVLCDFVSAALKAHGMDKLDQSLWPPQEYDIAKILDISQEAFWEKIDESVWLNAPKYIGSILFYHDLTQLVPNVIIATSPDLSPSTWTAKIRWLARHFEDLSSRDIMIGSKKHLMANDSTLLVDDSDKNCQAFRDAGGHAYVFPRMWNSAYVKYQTFDGPSLYAVALKEIDYILQVRRSYDN